MIVLPAIAAIVSLAFGVHLLARAARRPGSNPAEAVWGVAMLLYAAASGALALGVHDGWTTAEFRTYWLFGAVLNVPFLGLGEVYLLVKRRWIGHVGLLILLGLSAYAMQEVRTAPLDEAVLAREQFFTGKEVLGADAPARTLALWFSYAGTALLVLGILWSASSMRGRPELRSRTTGTLLIALGAVIVAGGAAFAARGSFGGFSLTLAAGAAVMYWGFLTAVSAKARAHQG